MRHYETQTMSKKVLVRITCDGCGTQEDGYTFSEVIISVRDGEEGGRIDTYDLCDGCLIDRAGVLIAAGSTAPFLTGTDE